MCLNASLTRRSPTAAQTRPMRSLDILAGLLYHTFLTRTGYHISYPILIGSFGSGWNYNGLVAQKPLARGAGGLYIGIQMKH